MVYPHEDPIGPEKRRLDKKSFDARSKHGFKTLDDYMASNPWHPSSVGVEIVVLAFILVNAYR